MSQKKVNQLKKQTLPSLFVSLYFNLNGGASGLTGIAALNPLVWYNPAHLTSSTFWKNDGTLGADYDLSLAQAGGGTVVENAVLGTAYRTSDASYARATIYTSGTCPLISAPYTIGVVYNVAGQGQEFNWLYGATSAQYSYIRQSTGGNVVISGLGGTTAINTQPFIHLPQYQITECGLAETAIKGKYSPSVSRSTGIVGAGEIDRFHLGSSNNFSSTGLSQELEIAAVFVVTGTMMTEMEAAILVDFPQLVGTPTSIPEPIIDYDARNFKLADAAAVSAWTNVGTAGAAWDLEQLTGGNQPTYIEGTYPSVKFTASDYLRMPATSSAVTWTNFKFGLVVRTTAASSQVVFQWNGDEATVFRNSMIQFAGATNALHLLGNGAGVARIEEAPLGSTWYAIGVDLSDFSAPQVSVNGGTPVTLGSISPGNTPNRIALGDGFPHLWDWVDGEIGRLVFYNTDEDIQNISAVLKTQWGI